MNREEKRQVIESLAAKLNEYPHFYITDIAELNAEQTAALRRQCFEKEVNLMVVKNTLFEKALEATDKADEQLPLYLDLMGLTPDDVDAFALSASLMNVRAYGIAAVYPAKGRETAVREGLEGFIDRQKQSFEQYLADQYDIASNARLETLEDGTVLLVMCQDQDAVFDAIRDTILAAA